MRTRLVHVLLFVVLFALHGFGAVEQRPVRLSVTRDWNTVRVGDIVKLTIALEDESGNQVEPIKDSEATLTITTLSSLEEAKKRVARARRSSEGQGIFRPTSLNNRRIIFNETDLAIPGVLSLRGVHERKDKTLTVLLR